MPDRKSYTSEFVSLFGTSDAPPTKNTQASLDHANSNTHPIFSSGISANPIEGSSSNLNNSTPTHFNDDVDQTTPNILLEQLAYVDNFLPSDFDNFMIDPNANPSSLQNANINPDGTLSMNNDYQATSSSTNWDFDDRLAIELGAFADNSFIYFDEDKNENDENDSDDNDDLNNKNNKKKNDNNSQDNDSSLHSLTKRKNTHLTSQYDQFKSRFNSKPHKSSNLRPDTDEENTDDHNEDDTNDEDETEHLDSTQFSNTDVHNDSPINNDDFTTFDVYATVDSATSNSVSTTTSNKTENQLELPDYTLYSTSSLLSILPKTRVPEEAITSLQNAGLHMSQINCIAVIMAYYERENKYSNSDSTEFALDNSTINAQKIFDLLKANSITHSNNSSINQRLNIFQSNNGKASSNKKRKIREYELESSVQELSQLVVNLQQKLHNLETENKLLKNLVMSNGKVEGTEKAESIKRDLLAKISLQKL